MRIADLATELKITESVILEKIKILKLRTKDGLEITAGVEMIVRDALADEGIGTKVVEPEPIKKTEKKAAAKPKQSIKVEAEDIPGKTNAKATAKKAVKAKSKRSPIVEKIIVAKSGPLPKTEAAQKPVSKPAVPEKSESTKPVPAQPVKVEVVKPAVEQIKVEASKVEVSKVEAGKVEPSKVDVSKIVVTPQVPVFEPVKKKVLSDEPFVKVKPLAKKRRKFEGDTGTAGGRDHRASTSIEVAESTAAAPVVPVDVELGFPITVKDFAAKTNQKLNVVLKKLLDMGVFANINQNLGEELVMKLAALFNINVIKSKTREEKVVDLHQQEKDDPASLKPRAPVVTFMGHVDHGKTSLLDSIRSSRIAQGEHGGITQHIGAYSVPVSSGGRITFLDTPGHEAFTAMRSRGAHITDMVVLVVAADEGIMPQTEEAIDHARAANVPIVVALNKIDKKTANTDRVKKQLADHDLSPEDWGGKVGVVGVSALTNEGINALLERILLEAEILELKANPSKKASGIVIEAHMSKGRGAIASLIVQSGTLREGDAVVVGPYAGRVKALFDDHEQPIKDAGPSMPVEILGLSEVPDAGEMFYVVEDEKTARDIAATRQEKIKNEKLAGSAKVSLEELYAQIQEGNIKEMRVIIKADVQGSLEALKESLAKIPTNEVKLRFMHAAVGDVNSSDVILALASQAVVLAFNVGIDTKAKEELEKNPVDVRQYRIIYDAVEDVRKALEGLLAPKLKRHFVGKIEVRNVFKLSKSGVVAGCYVQKGKVRHRSQVDVLRNGNVVFTGQLSSLKRFKDDVKEVGEAFECGLTVANFNDYQVGDIIEAFDIESIARKL